MKTTILQFGGGRFLRAFFDRFVQNANDSGQNVGSIVVVQSTPGARADLLNAATDGYRIHVRGMEDGEPVERMETIRSITKGLVADRQWSDVLALARSADLRIVVSNTTESGYATSPDDQLDASPPQSFPAKLVRVLWERFQAKGTPLTILPCELFEHNADRLRGLVAQVARGWKLPDAFLAWVESECLWLNNLVDCIVTNPEPTHPLAASDPLLQCAEPYALLVIERPKGRDVPLFTHPNLLVVDDVTPYHLRKVRMLNGIHTAMTAKFLPAGFQTVQQVVRDKAAGRWCRDCLFGEIVPVLAHRIEGVVEFADATWDRLRNPWQAHQLADISKYHADKLKIRLEPTRDEYQKLFGKLPPHVCEALAAKL